MAGNEGLQSAPIAPGNGGLESEPIGGPQTVVPLAGSAERNEFFVKSPITGDVRAVPQAEAAELVTKAGWEPVIEPAAERLLSNQLLRERSSPYTALGAGVFSGLTGGLGEYALPQGSEPGARSLRAAREEHPYAAFGGELAGTVAPFLAPAKGLRLLSVPGLAEAAGAGVTEGVGGGVLGRAAGVGLETGIQGATYEAGSSAIDDSPLTAQKLAAGFLLGATPGAILGGLTGSAESLFHRYGARGGVVRENILKPGLDDVDLMQIGQREHGVAVPGLSDEVLAGVANRPEVTPEVVQMARDAGPVGQQVRQEMLDASELRQGAYKRAADALNNIRDLDEAYINGVAGRMKGEQVRKWIPGGEENDPGMAVMAAWRDDTPEEVGVRQRMMEETNPSGPGVQRESFTANPAKKEEFTNFIQDHPNNQALQDFLNEERRGVSEYERGGTAGLGQIGIDGTRAGNVRRLASTEHGAQGVLKDAVEKGFADRGVFYRGEKISREFFENEIEPLLGHKNKHLENPNIWSTADTPEHAASFAKNGLKEGQVPVLYEINTKAAVPADRVPGSNTFEEHLMPRGRKLWVMDITDENGVKKIHLLDSDTPPSAARITPRGQFSTVEKPAGRVVEFEPPPSARADRIQKLGKAIEVWAHDFPEVDGELRRELGAGFGRKNLRDAVRRGLIGKDNGILSAVQRAYSNGSEESRAAFDSLVSKSFPIKSNPEVQPWRQHALELLDGMGQHAHALDMNPNGVIGKKANDVRKIRDLIADVSDKIRKSDKADAFIELDYLKKRLAKYAAPGEYLSVDQNAAAFARQQYEELRQNLERPELWGQKAANAQKDINRIFTQRISRGNVFFDKFYVDSGRAHPNNPWVRLKEATPDSVAKQLNGIIDPKQSREFQAFKQHIQESKEVLANIKQHYAITNDEASALNRWDKSVDDANQAFDLAAYYSRREAQANQLMKSHPGPIPSWGKWVALHFLGPAGFVGAAAAEHLINPGKGLYMRAVLERTLRTSESRIASAITKFVSGKGARITGYGLSQFAARKTVSLFGAKDRREAYLETVKHLATIANPGAATEEVKKALPFAAITLPNVPQNLGMSMSKAAQYILSKAPAQPYWTPQGIVVDHISDSQLKDFEGLVQGAFDPVSLFEDAATNKPVNPESVQAAEFIQPELVDHLRILTMSEITQSKKPMSYQKALNASILLGVDLDPTLDSEYIVAQQMMYSARQLQQSNPSDNRRTGNPTGVNKEYRNLNMSRDDQIEAGQPSS